MSEELKSLEKEQVQVQSSAQEKYYTVEELAAKWNVSPRIIVRTLRNQPGVIEVDEGFSAESSIRLRIPQRIVDVVVKRSDPAIFND